MSEFSDSYHLLGSDAAQAIALLKKAGAKGFVFPASNGKITFVADGIELRPNEAVISANTGTLIHFVSAEDFGLFFTVYNAGSVVFSYSCMWGENIETDDSELDYGKFTEWLRKNTSEAPCQEGIEAMLHPKGFEDIMEDPTLSSRIAGLLGISNYEWMSYYYMELRSEQGGLEPGIVFVE